MLTDRPAIVDALPAGAFHPAEFAFANLWLFRERHQYRWHDLPLPHITGLTYDGVGHALPLVPLPLDDARVLFREGVACLYPLGADAMALADLDGWDARHDPADSDYWYAADAMATLSGARTRRQQADAFAEQKPVAVTWHPTLADEAHAVLAGWEADVGRPATDTDARECTEALGIAHTLALEGMIARTAAGRPVAFLLASRSSDACIVHFAKARRAYSAALPWLFARYASDCGTTWLNFEQDLGKPGFAQAKRAYGPVRQQVKYRLFATDA